MILSRGLSAKNYGTNIQAGKMRKTKIYPFYMYSINPQPFEIFRFSNLFNILLLFIEIWFDLNFFLYIFCVSFFPAKKSNKRSTWVREKETVVCLRVKRYFPCFKGYVDKKAWKQF